MKLGRFKTEKGLTLVELMVALVIGLILIAGIYTLYRSTQDTYIGQEKLVELQQNSRIVLEQMSREMRLAGYLATCTSPTYATETAFEFEADADLNGTAERIQYRFNAGNLERASADPAPAVCTPMSSPSFQKIATNIGLLHFDYYDDGNTLKPAPVTGTDLAKLRRVTIRLESTTTDPLTGSSKKVSMMSDVRLRNEGLADTGGCPPPTAPVLQSVVDFKVCGRAKATWAANPQAEQITSYRIFSRPVGSTNWQFVNDTTGPVTSFVKTNNLVQDGTTRYEFAIAARNNCNVGPLSNIVTVGPLNDNLAPQAAAPPWLNEGATADTTGNTNTVTLNWNASVTTNYLGATVSAEDGGSDVSGYNVFRSGTQANGALLTTTSYTDTVPVACTIYNYQIRAEDTCGNISALSAAAYGDDGFSNSNDSPQNGTTNTRPSETVAPAEPIAFIAVAGGRYPPTGSPPTYRISLSWQNASDVDLSGTRVRYKQQNGACAAGDYPSSPTSSSTTFLVDEPGEPGASESHNYDIFTNNKYYCFTAFSYDACTNYSSGSTATSQAKTCGDDPAGAPPPIDLNSLKVTEACDVSGENRGSATIVWTTTLNQTNTPDLVGFNVYRTPAPNNFSKSFVYGGDTYYAITSTPVFFPSTFTPEFVDNADDGLNTCVRFGADGASDTTVGGDDIADNTGINGGPDGICDSTANNNAVAPADDVYAPGISPGTPQNPGITMKLLSGVTYKYIVRTADCSDNESTVQNSVTVKPGKIDKDPTGTSTTSGTRAKQNNIVNRPLTNTSASDLTLRNASSGQADTATITWTNAAARLTKIELDDTTLWEDTSATPTTTSGTTVTFTGTKTLSGLATGKMMKLTFKKSDGNTNIDMRGNTITVTIKFRNDTVFASSANNLTATCTVPFTMTVATGAALSNTTQNPPTEGSPPLAVTPKKSDEAGVPPGWLVDPSSNVVIETQATPQSGTSISSVKVYYYTDPAFVSAAPDPSVTTYTAITMTSVGGNLWTATIPAQSGNRVWFYIEAVDSKGQVSVDPSQTATDFIAFTYDPLRLQMNPLSGSWNPDVVCPVPDQVVVTGTVKDQDSSPISGATVVINITGTGGPDTNSVTTDASGNFTYTSPLVFTGDATVTVTASKTGYSPKSCSLPPIPFGSCLGTQTEAPCD